MPRYRICVVNGVFVAESVGEDGRVRPPGLFTALADALAAATGQRAWARWPYRTRGDYRVVAFVASTRWTIARHADYLAACIRSDLTADPLAPGESLAFVAYSAGVPIVQTAATLLRPAIPIGAFAFIGPMLMPRKVPRDWAGHAAVGCVIGERDWVQGAFPRVPHPWRGWFGTGMRGRLLAHLPSSTRVHTLPCGHWPGYFMADTWPLLVSALADLLRPVTAPEHTSAAH